MSLHDDLLECKWNLQELKQELEDVQAERNSQYWNFTRTARGKPVDPALTRKMVALEDQIKAIERGE